MLAVSLGAPSGPLDILCLGAHSDDIEIGCGGTMLRLLAEHPGSRVRWVVFSSTPEREVEARGSAADFLVDAGEAEVTVLSFRESYFPYVAPDIKDQFEVLKRECRPDVVLCHRRDDEHQDHRTIAGLVWNTFRDHLVLEYEIPKYEGDLGHPNVYVPLSTDLAERKIALLHQHFASQRNRSWFRPDTFRGIMAVRGVESNAPDGFAEAFHLRKCIL